MLPIDLNGRYAVVTGVTSGNGAAIAEKLALAGCHVAGWASHSRNPKVPRPLWTPFKSMSAQPCTFRRTCPTPADPHT